MAQKLAALAPEDTACQEIVAAFYLALYEACLKKAETERALATAAEARPLLMRLAKESEYWKDLLAGLDRDIAEFQQRMPWRRAFCRGEANAVIADTAALAFGSACPP